MNILVQFLYEVAVTDGEFLLLLQRNGEPVSLVYAVERALGLLVEIILCNLLSDVGNFVGCNDGSTHIDRLANHHASCPDIAGVGAESIYQFLSQRIALLLQGSQFLIHQSAYLLRYLRGNHSLTYKLAHQIAGSSRYSSGNGRADIAEC